MGNDELSDSAKVTLYCYGLLDELRRREMIDGGHDTLTEAGQAQLWALQAQGYKPTDVEVDECVNAIVDDAEPRMRTAIRRLALLLHDGRMDREGAPA